MNSTDRDKALALLHEYTESESLRKHALSVEAAMIWYAKHFNCPEDEQIKYGITGLLHDFDYERHPSSDPENGHPFVGNKILTELDYDEDIREAIMGHATYTGVERRSLMANTLFAVDELTGLITAATLVRPDKDINTLTLKSVKKKFKDKAFAAGCNREDIRQGAQELEIELDQHIENVIAGMRVIKAELEL